MSAKAIFTRADLGREKDTLVSLAAGLVAQVLLVVTGVLTARLLGPENRGYLALLLLVPSILWQAGSLGMPAALTFFIAREPTRARTLLRQLRPFLTAQVGVLLLLHAAIIWGLTRGEPRSVLVAALPTLVVVPASLAHHYCLAILQAKQRFLAFNVVRVLAPALLAPTLIALFVLGEDGLPALAGAYAAVSVAVAAIAVSVVATTVGGGETDRAAPALRPLLRFGVRAMLGASPPVETFRLDQAIVGLFLQPIALGLYVVSLSFTNLPRFIAQSVGMVAYPRVASTKSRDTAVGMMWRYFWLAVPLYGTVVLALGLAMPWLVPLFFGPEFGGAVPIARLLLISVLFTSARRVLAEASRGAGFEAAGSVAELVALGVLILATPVLLPLAGVEGVAIALAVSSAVGFAFLVWRVRRSAHAPTP